MSVRDAPESAVPHVVEPHITGLFAGAPPLLDVDELIAADMTGQHMWRDFTFSNTDSN